MLKSDEASLTPRIFFVPLQMMKNNGIESIKQSLESRLKQVDQTILELMRLKEDMICLIWKLNEKTHFKVEGLGGVVTYWSKDTTQCYNSDDIYPTLYKFSHLSEEEWSHLPSSADVKNLISHCNIRINSGQKRGIEFVSKDGSTLFLPFYCEKDFGEIWLLNATKFKYSENEFHIFTPNESDCHTAYIHSVIRVVNGTKKP